MGGRQFWWPGRLARRTDGQHAGGLVGAAALKYGDRENP
jgi:hypothetical protein